MFPISGSVDAEICKRSCYKNISKNSWSENRVFMATSNCCHINHGIIVSIKLTQNKEDLSNDNTRTIGETHHKRKNKETKSRYIYGNRFSDISFHPMDQYNRKI